MSKTKVALLAALLLVNAGVAETAEAANVPITGTQKLNGNNANSYALSESGKIQVDAGTSPGTTNGWAQVNELTGAGALEFLNGWVNSDNEWHPYLTIGQRGSSLPDSTLTLSVTGDGALRYVSDGKKTPHKF